jgi:chromosome segregation ATPase
MTIEEIERTLQTVAENQASLTGHAARTDESIAQIIALQKQHSTDIAEIDTMITTLVRSQNRYDAMLSRHDDILHDLADKHLKNEERFAETDKRFAQLADAQRSYEERQGRLEAVFEMLTTFVREARVETNGHFDQITTHLDQLTLRVDSLAIAQERTDRQIAAQGEQIASLNGRFDQAGARLGQVADLQAENAEQIKTLIAAQASSGRKPKAGVSKRTKKPAKKVVKRGKAK